MNIKNDTVLLLPDGSIAQNRKEACEMLNTSTYQFKKLFKAGSIKRINNPLTSSKGDEKATQ